MDDFQINEIPDDEIVKKMQYAHYEKFKSLVRMHLSFQLDLNTDEFDLPCHEVVYMEKGKIKKWNRLSKKVKSCASAKGSSPIESSTVNLTIPFIGQLRQLKDFLMKEQNVVQEGIFRKTGSVSRQNELRALITKEKLIDLENGGYSAHDCATVFKGFLSELPEPLLTDAHYPAHCQIADLCNGIPKNSNSIDNKKECQLLSSVQLLLLLLPEENRLLLEDIIAMLHSVIKHESSNKMSSENLATLFTPHLICPRNLPPEALHYVSQTMSSVVSFMITKGPAIFQIPAKLATDIRADFFERKRKKTMSPEQTLDESISDISTVNTVYTFVDREKTAAAHNSNTTDTELAQLYAYIQSLPESSKKRRLIKQFNKQNGQGTPLQLLNSDRKKSTESLRSAKSISDSIKKHIFHRGIMSRTPKRSAATPTVFGTPNGAPKNPKLRVLFQSPIASSASCNTPRTSSTSSFSLKNHPLQKSISSSSLLTSTVPTLKGDTSGSNTVSISAPVSRASSDIINPESSCSTPLQIINEAAKHLLKTSNEKKTVMWNEENMYDCDDTSEPSTPKNGTLKGSDMKSRYKSEPNLSRILNEKNCDETPSNKTKSLTQKLIKGVSMGNLRFPFTPDSVKRFGGSSSIMKRKTSNESSDADSVFQLNIDEEDENEDIESSDEDKEDEDEDSGGAQKVNVYRNLDLITSTPSLLLGRRSMSPITKSTQRMPKSMQESIMTPRSRKPVMLAATLGSLEQNQTIYQSDLSSFREQDEDSFLGQNEHDKELQQIDCPNENLNTEGVPSTLTNPFKEYLLTRSVLTSSPVDSSFSSQPDDFGSTPDIHDLEESQLSSSLLYCLDGNEPEEEALSSCDMDSQSKQTPHTRKRYASTMQHVTIDEDCVNAKKSLIQQEEHPGETSF